MRARVWAAVVVAAAVLAGVVLGATPARAAGTAWWLPSAWMSVASGTAGAVRAYLTGVGGSVTNSPALSLESTWQGTGAQKVSVRVTGVTASNLPKLQYAVSGSVTAWPADGEPWGKYNATTSGNLTCVDGYSQAIGGWTAEGAPNISAPCSVHGGVYSVWFHRSGFADTTRTWQWWTWYAGVESLVTQVTCRNLSTGVDTTVTESSTSGVAPMPVCPAGTVLVRAKITQGSVTLQDASITSSALDNFAGYIGDPGAWEWRSGSDPSDCYIQKSADPTMVIALSVSVCSEAHDNGYGQAEESTDCAGDLVCSAVEGAKSVIARILTGIATTANRIAEAVERVRSAVVGGIQSIVDAVQSVVQKITETADRIIEAINGVIEAIETGFRGLFDRWDQGLPGDGGGGGEGPGPGDVGPGDIGDPGDITSKFTPWTDALGDVIGGANRGDPGCKGPRVHFVMSGVVFDSYPLDACTAPMSTVAALCNAGIAVMVVVSGGLACIRIIASAFGLQTGQRGDA